MKMRGLRFLSLSVAMALSMSVSSAVAAELKAGVYYLRNVATGLYLSHGGRWGTHMAADSRGIDFRLKGFWSVTAVVDSSRAEGFRTEEVRVCKLFSRFDEDGCLGAEGYVDNKVDTELFIERKGKAYVVRNRANNCLLRLDEGDGLVYFSGESANDRFCQWEFVAEKDMVAQRMKAMRKASSENPVDVTWLMACPNVNNGHDLRMSSWKRDCDFGLFSRYGIYEEDSEPAMMLYAFDPALPDICFNTLPDFKSYQSASLVPGRYKLEAQGFFRDGDVEVAAERRAAGTEVCAYLFAGDSRVPLRSVFDGASAEAGRGFSVQSPYGFVPGSMTEAGYAFQTGAYENELFFEVPVSRAKSTVMLGVCGDEVETGGRWMIVFDNFRLTYYGPAVSK